MLKYVILTTPYKSEWPILFARSAICMSAMWRVIGYLPRKSKQKIKSSNEDKKPKKLYFEGENHSGMALSQSGLEGGI